MVVNIVSIPKHLNGLNKDKKIVYKQETLAILNQDKKSLGNDFQRHLQNSNMIKTDVRNFMQKVIPANQNSRGYQTSSMITTGALDGIALGSAAAAGYQFINKAASFTNNALTAMKDIRLKPTNVNTAEMFPTNRLQSGLDIKQMLKDVKKYTSSKNLFAKDFNTKISGYTKHGLSQVIGRDNGRGVAIKSILDAAKNPVKIIKTKNNTYQIIGKEATIVLNSRGKIVTAWGKPRNFKK